MSTNFVATHLGGGYASEDDKSTLRQSLGDLDSSNKRNSNRFAGRAANDFIEREQHEGRKMYGNLYQRLNAFGRHQKMMSDWIMYYGGKRKLEEQAKKEKNKRYITDEDINRENYRFVRTEADDAADTYEARLAQKYYSKLFREYCLADMSFYKEGKMGLRWRTQEEVINGKGQFVCGNLKCDNDGELRSHQVNFAYLEHGVRKSTQVKLRVCNKCAYKLNYKKIKKMEEDMVKQAKKARKKKKEKKKKEKKTLRKLLEIEEEIKQHLEVVGRATRDTLSAEKKTKNDNLESIRKHSRSPSSESDSQQRSKTRSKKRSKLASSSTSSVVSTGPTHSATHDEDQFLAELMP